MGASEWISIAALIVAALGAFWAAREARTAKEALELAKKTEARVAAIDAREAVRFSAERGAAEKSVKLANKGHSPIWLLAVSVRRGTLTSRQPFMWEKVDRGAGRLIDFWNFDVASGDELTVEYQTTPRDQTTNGRWTDTLR